MYNISNWDQPLFLPVPNFQSNSVLNQNDSQKHISTDSDSVHVIFSSEIPYSESDPDSESDSDFFFDSVLILYER